MQQLRATSVDKISDLNMSRKDSPGGTHDTFYNVACVILPLERKGGTLAGWVYTDPTSRIQVTGPPSKPNPELLLSTSA